MNDHVDTRRPLKSVGLVSVRQDLEADPLGTLQRLKELGYEAVEPMRRTGTTPEQRDHIQRVVGDAFDLSSADISADVLADALRQTGLKVSSCLVSMPEGPYTNEILDEQEQLGSTMLVLPSIYNPRRDDIPVEDFTNLDDIKRSAERVNIAAQNARERGMRLGYHNHSWEISADFDGRSGLEVFFDLVDPDVFAELDVYWAHVGGRSPAAMIDTLGSRVGAVHIKDGPGSANEPNMAVGSGAVDMPPVLERIQHLSAWTVEFDFAVDMWGALAESHDYVAARMG